MTRIDIEQAQGLLGVKQDGDWGPKSTAAVRALVEKLALYDESIGDQLVAPIAAPSFSLGPVSMRRLSGVHVDLVQVMLEAADLVNRVPVAERMPFIVTDGVRTLAYQKQLVERGASDTLNSRHLTGHAVDIAPFIAGSVSYHWPQFHVLAPMLKQAAKNVGITVEWGGDWKKPDGPHWQLPWSKYK